MKWNEFRQQQKQGLEQQKKQTQPTYLDNPYAPSTIGTTVTNLSTATRQYAPQSHVNINYQMQEPAGMLVIKNWF